MLRLIRERLGHLLQCSVCRERLRTGFPAAVAVERVMPSLQVVVTDVVLPAPRVDTTPAESATSAA